MTDLVPDDNELITAVAVGKHPALRAGGTNNRCATRWSSLMEPNPTVASHAAARDLLGAFALGTVDAEEAATVRRHLATCAECQAEIAGLWTAVDSLPDISEPMDPPPGLRD